MNILCDFFYIYMLTDGVVQQTHSVYIMRVSEQYASSSLAGKGSNGG
jgi:hypothetical protein